MAGKRNLVLDSKDSRFLRDQKEKTNEFCHEMLSILENIAYKLENVGQFFPSSNPEL